MGHGGAGGGVASRRALLQRSLRFDLCDCMDCLFSFFPFFWPNDVARGRGGAQTVGVVDSVALARFWSLSHAFTASRGSDSGSSRLGAIPAAACRCQGIGVAVSSCWCALETTQAEVGRDLVAPGPQPFVGCLFPCGR